MPQAPRPRRPQYDQNTRNLATVIMSEASVGNETERAAVGWTLRNRMLRNDTSHVEQEWRGYAHNQHPTAGMLRLAQGILNGTVPDPTNGATHFYSPVTMPAEGDSTAGFDVTGGLEQIQGMSHRNYRPGWAGSFAESTVVGATPSRYKFYRAPGDGRVR